MVPCLLEVECVICAWVYKLVAESRASYMTLDRLSTCTQTFYLSLHMKRSTIGLTVSRNDLSEDERER